MHRRQVTLASTSTRALSNYRAARETPDDAHERLLVEEQIASQFEVIVLRRHRRIHHHAGCDRQVP